MRTRENLPAAIAPLGNACHKIMKQETGYAACTA